MKVNKKILVGVGLLSASLMLAGCDDINNDVQDVYGPPISINENEDENNKLNEVGDVITDEEIQGMPNDIPDVYGPPIE